MKDYIADYQTFMGGGKKLFLRLVRCSSFLFLVSVLFAACTPRGEEQLCGVPIGGTPWQFIARFAEGNDTTFVPLCVSVSDEVAYVEGVLLEPEEKSVVLVCTLKDGNVVRATIMDDNERED